MGDDEQTIGQRCSARASAFSKFMYNSERGTIMGRTPKSWALIGLFYLVYYSLLACFFTGMLSVLLFGIVDDKVPMLTGEHSVMRMNPGLGMRPQPDVERTLVRYNLKVSGSSDANVANLREFFNASRPTYNSSVINCTLSDANANADFDPMKKLCVMDPATAWGPCQPGSNFGYDKGQPCVVIKMNRVYGWLPEVQDMSNHTMLECVGENDGDAANIGELKYYPSLEYDKKQYGYFSSALFPYLRQDGHRTPTVAVQFASVRRNVLVMVECRLKNLKNSEYSKMDRLAMVRFELVVYDY